MFKLLTTISIAILSFNISAGEFSDKEYCAAIRGNGELMPAHWGAMSKLVENYGMPTAMAGGSSASITMFLLESIAMNPLARNNEQKALLVKSIEGYVETLAVTDEGKAILKILSDKEGMKKLQQLVAETTASGALNLNSSELLELQIKHMQSIQVLMRSSDLKEILNPEMMNYTLQTIKIAELAKQSENLELMARVQYRYGQINEAIKNFGKFSTQSDNTLFFRPGLISFEKVALLFGRMGDFFALSELVNSDKFKVVQQTMTQFLTMCSPDSNGKTWQEINQDKPHCRQLLGKAILTYRQEPKKVQRIHQPIGQKISAFPTTSILIAGGKKAYEKALQEYQLNSDSNFGKDFQIHHTQYRFGYWGKNSQLEKINKNLQNKEGYLDGNGVLRNFSQDKKSQKFTSLGESSWFSVLSTSPAEPGLSRIVNVKQFSTEGYHVREDILSAGGWNDLHPTLILNALGCKNVVYVTRRGGDSMFGQGVVRKLTRIGGFDWQDWEGLSDSEKWERNAQGDPLDVGSEASSWSQLYNLANPESSFSRSLKVADAVVCSNWDRQNIRNGLHSVVLDGFKAPMFFQNKKSELGLISHSFEELDFSRSLDFAGCIPKH